MKRLLITGISGVGKSTVVSELGRRGYHAVDTDNDEFSEWRDVSGALAEAAGSPVQADKDWVWREDRIQELLSTEHTETLFVIGCAANMGQFLSQFDHVILLSAPADILVERLHTRTTNAYGKHPDEVERVLQLKQSVEPLLRNAAGHEINTNASLDDVVASVLQLARPQNERNTRG